MLSDGREGEEGIFRKFRQLANSSTKEKIASVRILIIQEGLSGMRHPLNHFRISILLLA